MIGEELGDCVDAVGGNIASGDEQVEQDWERVVGMALVAKPIKSYQAYFAIRRDIW